MINCRYGNGKRLNAWEVFDQVLQCKMMMTTHDVIHLATIINVLQESCYTNLYLPKIMLIEFRPSR